MENPTKNRKKKPVYFWVSLSENGRRSTVYVCCGPDVQDIGKQNMAERTTDAQASYLEKCCRDLGLRSDIYSSEDSHEVNFRSTQDAWNLSNLLVKKGWIRLGTGTFGDGSEPYCFSGY